jgi:hypothetical protein
MTTDAMPLDPTEDSLGSFAVWPNLKLVRGQSHLGELHSRVNSWRASEPHHLRPVIAEDRLSWKLVLDLNHPAPTDEWALIAGDCIHNFRSALDAAVWALATINGATPPNSKGVGFPIVADSSKWMNQDVRRQLHGVPQKYVERIESVQPYNHTTPQGRVSALSPLHELDIEDKHHAGVTASIVPTRVTHFGSVEFESDEAAQRNTPPNSQVGTDTSVDGAVLIETTTVDPIARVHGEFGIEIFTELATEYGLLPLRDTLWLLNQATVNTLNALHGGDVAQTRVEVPLDASEDGEPRA